MLRATHRVLRPQGRLCFFVIVNPAPLTDAQRARLAERDGNEHVESKLAYEEMLTASGFGDVEVLDMTAEYIETIKAWKAAWEGESADLIELLGEEEFSHRLHNRDLDIANAEDGLLCRVRCTAVKKER